MTLPPSHTDFRPPEPAPLDDPRLLAVADLIGIVDRLRAPDGCPWDLEQSEKSMLPSLLEEVYELQEALEEGTAEEATAEAGDVLMNVVLIARIAEDEGRYDLARVARGVSEKLVRRHPHVFGELTVDGSGEVLRNWEAIKKVERQEKREDASALAGVPKALPGLQRASRMCEKALHAGFRWQDVAGALAKVDEELAELKAELPPEALSCAEKPEWGEGQRERASSELGDLMLAGAFLGRYLGLDVEEALRGSLRRFETRFRSMEDGLEGAISDHSLDQLIEAWRGAKAATSAED
ncbi:MAG: MazG family protein [Planctomycetota bacterium]|jgi:MazG family protein